MISVVVPTYNEAENLPELVEHLDRALAGRDYEVVVVDDRSPDGTAEVAKRLSGRYPVRVLVREDRRGLSSAVVEGARLAAGEVIVVMTPTFNIRRSLCRSSPRRRGGVASPLRRGT
jgi:Glycosyltransferases involved in cell wall biogenesis